MADGKGKSNHYSPVKQQGSGGFMNFLWNSNTGEFLGRTGASWFKITVFYIFFFAGLAAFFGLMLWIFLQTLNPNQPKWIGEEGLIGGNPGIGFRPMPDQDKNVESTLIWFNRNTEQKNSYWGTELKKFLDKNYQNTTGGAGNPAIECGFGPASSSSAGHATKDQACLLDKSTMLNKACTWDEFEFGYGAGAAKPCVLIKLNKIYDWKPLAYKTLSDLDLAEKKGMPAALIEKIRNKIKANPNDPELETIWVTCEGENPADRENIGPLEYYSAGIVESGDKGKTFQGIPNYFFPYQKQDNYKAPFVFVKFTKPQSNVLIQVECKAWAKNIEPDRQQRLGSVHFELMLD